LPCPAASQLPCLSLPHCAAPAVPSRTFGARRGEPYRAASVSCPRSCRTLPCCALPCPPCLSLLRCLAPLLCASPCPAVSQLPCLSLPHCAAPAVPSRTFRCPPCRAASRRIRVMPPFLPHIALLRSAVPAVPQLAARCVPRAPALCFALPRSVSASLPHCAAPAVPSRTFRCPPCQAVSRREPRRRISPRPTAPPRLSFPASACLTALRPPCHPALFGARRAEPHRAVSLAGAFRRALPPCRSWPAVVCPHCHAVSRERGPGAAPPMPFRRHSALTRRPAAAWSVQIVCIVAPYARAPRRVHVPQLARAAISPSQLISLSSRTRCRPRIATPPRGPSRADQAPAAHPLTPSNPNIPYGLGGGSGMRYFVSHGETRADFSRRFGAWSRTSGI
jgi:hypothetical protein